MAELLIPSAPPALAAAPDDTERFLELFREVRLRGRRGRASLPHAAYYYDYLLIPGLLTRWNAGYMRPNLERLAALGLRARVAWAGHTMGTVAGNGAELAGVLESLERPVVLLCHSKGALDVWEALARRPALADRVRALVAVQSPVRGSQFADWYRENALKRWVVRSGARLLGGEEQAVWDLTTDARERYLREQPFPSDRVPCWSVATLLDRATHRFYLGRHALRSRGAGPNDGVVEADRAVIPGSRVLRLADMDHLDPFTGHVGIEEFFSSTTYDPETLTEALVRLVFTTPQP